MARAARGCGAAADEKPRHLFPALTPAQRYHFEVYGYVVIPQLLSESENTSLLAELHELRASLAAEADAAAGVAADSAVRRYHSPHPGGAVLEQRSSSSLDGGCRDMDGLQNLSQLGGLITGYAAHPRLIASATELLGGEARLMQEDAIINRRPGPEVAESFIPGWHRGAEVPFATHTSRGSGLVHCNFIKALTNLTPLGPMDGGTLVSEEQREQQDTPDPQKFTCPFLALDVLESLSIVLPC